MLITAEAQVKEDTLTTQKIDSLSPAQVDTLIKKMDTVIITKEPQNITPTSSFGRAYASSYWTDTKSLVTNPFRWKTGQIITAAAVVAATAGLIAWGDKPIQQFYSRNSSVFIQEVNDIIVIVYRQSVYICTPFVPRTHNNLILNMSYFLHRIA